MKTIEKNYKELFSAVLLLAIEDYRKFELEKKEFIKIRGKIYTKKSLQIFFNSNQFFLYCDLLNINPYDILVVINFDV